MRGRWGGGVCGGQVGGGGSACGSRAPRRRGGRLTVGEPAVGQLLLRVVVRAVERRLDGPRGRSLACGAHGRRALGGNAAAAAGERGGAARGGGGRGAGEGARKEVAEWICKKGELTVEEKERCAPCYGRLSRKGQ